jgi:hypothetical protein
MQEALWTDAETDEAIKLALERARKLDQEWCETAYGLVYALAKKGEPFTSEDVTDELGPPPGGSDPRALGGILRAAREAKLIMATGWTSARRKSRHKAPIRIWKGTGWVDKSHDATYIHTKETR